MARVLLGLDDSLIEGCFDNVTQYSMVSSEDFQLLYFKLFKDLQLGNERLINFEQIEEQ